jgi:hypothetical protein
MLIQIKLNAEQTKWLVELAKQEFRTPTNMITHIVLQEMLKQTNEGVK